MQHIGIVACSAEGASLCFETICRLGLEAVGKNDHPRITMDAIPLARWMPAFEAGDHEAIGRIMVESATVLARAGADFAICPDNSAHLAWAHVQQHSPIPWLHIVDELAAEAVRRGHRRVGVLGTRFTMSGPLYTDVLGPLGIEVVVPDGDDFDTVDRIIFDELIDGVFTPDSRDAYAGGHRPAGRAGAATRSRWRAPRSRCSSTRTTRRSRSSTRPACWQPRRCAAPWPTGELIRSSTGSRRWSGR